MEPLGPGTRGRGIVDVVIVAYNSGEALDGAVNTARPLGGRVIVVDHGDGHDACRARALGATAVHDPSNPGFGAGQNRGVALTDSPYVLLCNPDAEVDPEAIRAGARLLDMRPDVAAVQGVVVNRTTGRPERSQGHEPGPVQLFGRAIGARRLLRLRPVRAVARRCRSVRDDVVRVPYGPTEVESLAATALLARRRAYDDVLGFDPRYFLYGEDVDLCRRLRANGWKLVAVPEQWAVHLNGASSGSGWEREMQWWQGTLLFAARWWGERAWATARVAAVVRGARLAVRRPAGAARVWRVFVTGPGRTRAAATR